MYGSGDFQTVLEDNDIESGCKTQPPSPPSSGLFGKDRFNVDLDAQTVTMPDTGAHAFAIDPFSRQCLLQGLDELNYTLTQIDLIEAFERRRDAAEQRVQGQDGIAGTT